MTKREKNWSLIYCSGSADEEVAQLARETGFSTVMARLLYSRGYRTEQAVCSLLQQEESRFHDPFLMLDMQKAVDRIRTAVEQGEKIAIYGDYDVDGVTSVSLLYLYLRSKGVDVEYYIPNRITDGYGLSASAIDELASHGVSLMITVDTGVTAVSEVEYAKSLGVETVITDHHECRPDLPMACAVVNPHRCMDPYPFKELAGVGVIFKVICACEMDACRRQGMPEVEGVRAVCKDYADLVAIGTVADVMPVIDENRLIVTLGLSMMQNTHRPGLYALMEAANGKNTKKRKINSSFISFTIAPRINAAGRVSDATLAVKLLLTEDNDTARELADRLCKLNVRRQAEENRITEEADAKIAQTLTGQNNRVIVISDDNWHPGVIGVVSSRVTDRYGLPSVLVTYSGSAEGEPTLNDIGKGSGRSVKGLNLVGALASCEDLLIRYGGHELAAGLSICRCNLDSLRDRLNQYTNTVLGDRVLRQNLDADCEVDTSDLTLQLVREIERLEPFGIANPTPVFLLRNATLCRILPMANGKHSKMILHRDGRDLSAVWFGTAPTDPDLEENEPIDLLFQLGINEYMGSISLQMIVQDARLSADYAALLDGQRKRYEEIRSGAPFEEDEGILPTREDIATVYRLLLREYRNGRTVFSLRRILALLRGNGGNAPLPGPISYGKLKFIVRIMQELNICGVTETDEDRYVFEFYFSSEKTNIDRSSILRRLKSQCRRGGDRATIR